MSSVRGKSKSKKPLSSIPKEKENDTFFLLQNQNQILKLKTQQLNVKIGSMQKQLKSCTQNLQRDEYQCDTIRNQIKMSQFCDDMRLQKQKIVLEDKIALAKGNMDILERKIKNIRETTLLEEQKIPEIIQQKKLLERQLWEQKTKIEGLKVVLDDLEAQLQRSRSNNQLLLAKKKTSYGPKQKQLSNQIQERIRLMKNTKGKTDALRKRQGSELLSMFLHSFYLRRQKQSIMLLERGALRRKIMQKRVFLLSLIRRKYVDSIKASALQKFREKFRPLAEQEQFYQILKSTITRRIKNRLFRIWRAQSIKQQFNKTRHFQVQNTIQTLGKSFDLCNLSSAFSILKYYKNHPIKQRHAQSIYTIMNTSYKRNLNFFFSSMQSRHNNLLLNDDIDQSAKQHSIFMIQALYFGEWAKITKENKVSNRMLKFRYFRQMKKLRKIRRKRQLSQMLSIAHQKIKQIDMSSIVFCELKKERVYGLLDQLSEDFEGINNKNHDLAKKTSTFKEQTKQLYHTLGLLKISKHLKGRVDKAFNIWRQQNRKVKKFNLILNLLSSKIYSWVNFGFAKIQRRRFQKLKLSIADKIESCQFSYNYLLKQNKHIKQVLDNKLLELEKSKFVNIIHRLIRNEKQIKHKYFFKFLRSGYKCWKFKKIYQRADTIIELRTKVAAFFMFKYVAAQKRQQQYLQRELNKKIDKIDIKRLSLCFGVMENINYRNKKVKKILQNVFSRNMELNVYVGYGEIKRIYLQFKQGQIDAVNESVLQKIKQCNQEGDNQQRIIEVLSNRLESKQQSIYMRISLACRKIYLKNYCDKVILFFGKWRKKVAYQGKIRKFAQILDRKSRIIVKQKFALNFFRNQKQKQYRQLKSRLNNFKTQLDSEINSFQQYTKQSEQQMKNMEVENQQHDKNSVILEKKTIKMDQIKIQSFRRYWGKMMCAFILRDWRHHTTQFIHKWRKAYDGIRMASLRYNFAILSEEMKEQILRTRLKTNLSKIYSKTFRHNARLGFNIWRLTNVNKKIQQFEKQYNGQVQIYQRVKLKHQYLTQQYNRLVNYRIGDRKMRKIFDFLKKYTRVKLDNNKRKKKLQEWLKKGYQIEFNRLFITKFTIQVQKKHRADAYYQSKPQVKSRNLFYALKSIVERKKIFNKLFLNKYIHYATLQVYEEFFAKTKNYYKYVEFCKKDRATYCIQKVIETFQKRRKKTLGNNIRRWRRNQFQIDIGRNLFRRLTRKSFCSRYQGMFYAWKLETEARNVVAYNTQQGQVKKRKKQIKRLETFIQQLKKKKGLLLQNQDGNFVVSPRFQKKKQQQDKKQKNLRYKFVSRLILSMNGYAAPIRAYNNLQVYMKLRQRYKTKAQFVLNHLRKPDLLLAFRTWRKAATEFRQSFETMQRKDLIKILNKQKDKMEMQYSHKLEIDDKIKNQLQRYQIYTHQKQKKQKICGYVLIKHANKVKQNAFRSWREKANEIKQQQLQSLQNKGYNKMSYLEQELRELDQLQRQYNQSNRFLKQAVSDALSITDMVKKITEQRDRLSALIAEKNLTCQSLLEQNQVLNSRLYQAQKQAMNLLIISAQKP